MTDRFDSIKKAAPLSTPSPIFAVKFINKRFAEKYGRIKQKQLQMETSLHRHIGAHRNIIEFYSHGEDAAWLWIAMELAEGGDLFDKIEADAGVNEDIAHVYFTQLINAVGYMHSKGVGHRDIKPENMLLTAEGELKVADFGMATLFEYGGKKKLAVTLCGSPPYVAPEVLACSSQGSNKGQGYAADLADIWSCGVVLFTLLAGNTPWSKPVQGRDEYGRLNEYSEYVQSHGRPDDELWSGLPTEVLSLLRGMLCVDAEKRYSLDTIRRHPWFTRRNRYMDSRGRVTDAMTMATNMFESLHVSFDSDSLAAPSREGTDRMDADEADMNSQSQDLHRPDTQVAVSSTQPITPAEDMLFDWERPSHRRPPLDHFSTTQPTRAPRSLTSTQPLISHNSDINQSSQRPQWLADEPTMSQFSQRPQVPYTLTQLARKFNHILPNTPLTKFYSLYTLNLLVPLVLEALTRLSVPIGRDVSLRKFSAQDTEAVIKIRTNDSRGCALSGTVMIEVVGDGLVEIEFVKASGDPLEWRRLFKKVVVQCRDLVYRPDE